MRRAAVLAIACAISAAAADRDPWLKITSPNFELYTTAGERSGRDLVRHFEQVRSFFLQAFGGGLANAKPARIIAFRNEKEYEAYRPNEFASAFFQPGEAHDFIVMSSAASEHFPVAVHEFTHLMVHQSGAHYPPWLNEGVAELFSNLQPIGGKIKVGQDIPGRMHTLATDKWIPLSTLLTVDHNSPIYNEKSKAGMFYAESWELVHMLFLNPDYSPRLKAMAAALKEGDAAAAFQTAYQKPIGAIESDLHTYLRGSTIKVFLFDVQLPKNIDAPEIESSAGMSARLALAELLTNYRGKQDQALAAYESLAKDYPKDWEVEAGWGQWSWHQRRLADAAAHYARSVELGGRSPGLFLDYGRVLFYANRTLDAIDVLGKAARLNPDSDEIHFELGGAYLRNGSWGAALAELRAMKKVKPAEAYRYFYNRAFAEHRLGAAKEAKEHAATARKYTRNPEEVAALDRLVRSLDAPAVSVRSTPDIAATPPADSGEPTTLRRRAAAPDTPSAPVREAVLPAIEGTLENMECAKVARLHVRVEGKIRVFVIPDPRAVTIRSGNGEPVDLQCGPQKSSRGVRIEYQMVAGQTDPVARSLEFR
jgi:tetratricopeptide (TPR) repeat protein